VSGTRVLVAGASIAGPAQSQLLYDDTRDGVEYVFDDRIAELTRTPTGSRWSSRAATGGVSFVHSRGVPDPDAQENTQPGAEPDMEALMELVERAINGVELPDYAEVPDSGAPAGPPVTPSARP
jgi:hypothetical protein